MNDLLKQRDEQNGRLQNTLGALQHEKDLLMKKLNEVEMNNNDLTVRSSRKELQSI